MSRDRGFRRADIDVHFLDDPKLRRLYRQTGDRTVTMSAALTYLAVVLASWEAGERIALSPDLFPEWMPELDTAALVALGRLDEDGRIPEDTWVDWFGPAFERRLVAQRRAIYGGLRSSGMDVKEANREADRRAALLRSSDPESTSRSQPQRSTSSNHPPIHPPGQPTGQGWMDEETAPPAPARNGAPGVPFVAMLPPPPGYETSPEGRRRRAEEARRAKADA